MSELTDDERRRFGPAQNRADAAEKLRRFLTFDDSYRFPDSSPMWFAGGVVITWGDIRRLVDLPPVPDPELGECPGGQQGGGQGDQADGAPDD